MTRIFIDGSVGTTGLKIYERLSERKDLELIRLAEEVRKDPKARKDAIDSSDITFLCLPDAAAIEAAGMCENPDTVIIDTSTAHRTNDAWTYGFPELGNLREEIRSSKRIANPGCHASGFISLVAPLIEKGLLKKDALLSCCSLTGYSGGGKKMIADYDTPERQEDLKAPRLYGLTQSHKHLPEMVKVCGLTYAPHFCPIVSSYYSGMEVMVPLFPGDLNGGIKEIEKIYEEYYTGKIVKWVPQMDESGFISAGMLSGRDDLQVTVTGNEERIVLISRFDNLGKGASGAAIQNMNIVLGLDEATGLCVED